MRTPALGGRRGSSISGVFPIDWTMSPYRPPQGRFLNRSAAITSRNIATLLGRAGAAGRRDGASAQACRGLAYGCRVARIPPLPAEEWDEELRAILDVRMRGVDVRLGDNNIFTTLARHKGLFRSWLPFGGWLLGSGVL